MEWFGKFLITSGVLILIALAVFLYVLITSSSDRSAQIRAEAMECERQGGVYLDRTYNSGKTTGHIYTCVNKNVVIW